jgi:hypothetical protein
MRKTVARPVARRRVEIAALLLLAFAAVFAFGDSVRASNAATGTTSSAVGAQLVDDVHAIAAIPGRTADWATTHPRGAPGNDRLVAVLLGGALLVIALVWRRASIASYRSRSALGAHRAASRAPPAFV